MKYRVILHRKITEELGYEDEGDAADVLQAAQEFAEKFDTNWGNPEYTDPYVFSLELL